MMHIINLLVVLGILFLGYFWSNRRYEARGVRLIRRWSGRKVKRFLIISGALALVSWTVLLGGLFYRFGRWIGWVPGLAGLWAAIGVLFVFALYEYFLFYLMDVGSCNSRLRARIAVKKYVERQRKRRAIEQEIEQEMQAEIRSEMEQTQTEAMPEPSKVIKFPRPPEQNEPAQPETAMKRRMFVTIDEPAVGEVLLTELKTLVFNLSGCKVKAKDCGDTILLSLEWIDEKGRKRSGEWRLDKNSPDYLWVIEQTATLDVEMVQEILSASAQTC